MSEIYSHSLYQHSLSAKCDEKNKDLCDDWKVDIEKEYRLNSMQKEIYGQLDLQFQSLDEILCKLNEIEIQKLMIELADMERKGMVEEINGFYRMKQK